jgi:hypothetical protein
MRKRVLLTVLLLSAAPALADVVTVAPSATVIPQGGTASFTVTVSPGAYVQSVTLTYQGESGQDVLTSPPYVASRQFNTPALDKLITATVTYTNGAGPDQGTTTIDIIGVTLTGPASPMRGTPGTYTFKALPAGTSIADCDWTYLTNSKEDTDGNDTSVWTGTMVKSGTIDCTATILGLAFNVQKTVNVLKRNWSTPITCAQDNEADYGEEPVPDEDLGLNRDRDGNMPHYIFVPRVNDTFSGAVTRACVSSGPCQGLWYVTATSLKCQRETVINRYIKSDGPELGGINFFEANDGVCFAAADFLQAVKNHEYRGTPDTPRSYDGHQGRIEYLIQLAEASFPYDPRKQIEELTAATQQELVAQIEDEVTDAETAVWSAASMENFDHGPNWGNSPGSLGEGANSRWDGSGWTDCIQDPLNF